jgi:uncharacterized protein YdcH (DUF465 family)
LRRIERRVARSEGRADVTEARQNGRKVIYCLSLFTRLRKELASMDKVQADSLASKHAALHAMIDEEEHRSHPNEDLLHQLKKEKLRLKDELAGHFDK